MMQGRGVTNYATDAPSYGFTAATTEFDDELMKRDIVTHEQVLLAKGASAVVVQELLSTKRATGVGSDQASFDDDPADHDSSVADDGDEEAMRIYRQQRYEELCKDNRQGFGKAVRIHREEWLDQVNEASENHWVVVCLVSTPYITGGIEACVQSLAHECKTVKFVLIEAKHAFSREWPEEHLPTLFLYRYGRMQQQLLSLKKGTNQSDLEALLEKYGVR